MKDQERINPLEFVLIGAAINRLVTSFSTFGIAALQRYLAMEQSFKPVYPGHKETQQFNIAVIQAYITTVEQLEQLNIQKES